VFSRPPLLPTLLATAVAVALTACPTPLSQAQKPPASPFVRGMGLGLFATNANYNYAHLLDEIRDLGATDVLLVIPLYQQNVSSHDIDRRPGKTPSDVAVLRTLQQAKARGLRTSVLPIVRLTDRSRRQWRGRIQPKAGVDAWFAAYEKHLLRYATIAERGGADRFVVGSELLSLERHERQWRLLIGATRKVFTGKLTYSANWDHFDPIQFWDALDEVGVTAYFELVSHDGQVTDLELDKGWVGPAAGLARLQRRLRKPLFITEVGYPAKVTAARYPWDETRKAALAPDLQAQLYRAFCRNLRPHPDDQAALRLSGFFFWNWFGFGGLQDGDYTPRGKPAAEEARRCYADKRWD